MGVMHRTASSEPDFGLRKKQAQKLLAQLDGRCGIQKNAPQDTKKGSLKAPFYLLH